MKNIFTDRIDYLKFEDGETIRSTRIIRAIRKHRSQIIYIYIDRERERERERESTYGALQSTRALCAFALY
jgi:hypothetical protein